jgi:hypothetical protein
MVTTAGVQVDQCWSVAERSLDRVRRRRTPARHRTRRFEGADSTPEQPRARDAGSGNDRGVRAGTPAFQAPPSSGWRTPRIARTQPTTPRSSSARTVAMYCMGYRQIRLVVVFDTDATRLLSRAPQDTVHVFAPTIRDASRRGGARDAVAAVIDVNVSDPATGVGVGWRN